MEDPKNVPKIEMAASELIKEARSANLPAFISDRLAKLQILINMITDEEWQLNEDERASILGDLYYFINPEDLIPDNVPGIGYLDDAIYAEIIIQELKTEIKMYRDFCQFRIAEENRRRNRGLDPPAGREACIADMRAVLHSRMRERRALRTGAEDGGCACYSVKAVIEAAGTE